MADLDLIVDLDLARCLAGEATAVGNIREYSIVGIYRCRVVQGEW